jgi:hypothetical protein
MPIQTDKHPKAKNVVIVARVNGNTVSQSSKILVGPVFNWLVSLHQDGAGQKLHRPTTDDYNRAWHYARWKYSIATPDLASVAYVNRATPRGLTMGANAFSPRYCTLGNGAFANENICASTLGHEQVHGAQPWDVFILPNWIRWSGNPEVPAYQWEIDDATNTGIDTNFLNDTLIPWHCRQRNRVRSIYYPFCLTR